MKVTGSSSVSSFSVSRMGDTAEIRFHENAEEIVSAEGNGSCWQYDEYILTRPWRPGLESDIEANYTAWLEQAKAEEEARTPVDEWQLRADVDFLQITQTAMMGIATMSEGSDPNVLEKARQYYPKRWSKEQLQMLVSMQKISEDDFLEITGEAFSA